MKMAINHRGHLGSYTNVVGLPLEVAWRECNPRADAGGGKREGACRPNLLRPTNRSNSFQGSCASVAPFAKCRVKLFRVSANEGYHSREEGPSKWNPASGSVLNVVSQIGIYPPVAPQHCAQEIHGRQRWGCLADPYFCGSTSAQAQAG